MFEASARPLVAVGTAKESMHCGAFFDMLQYMHLSINWEEKE
jgi:hypothetical protein